MSLGVTLDRLEEGWAILKLGDGQEFSVASSELPLGLKPGDLLELEIRTAQTGAVQPDQARKLLTDILQGK